MRINDNMFVINVEEGKILHYMSISDDGADMHVISLSESSLKILEEKCRSNNFIFTNDDRTLEIHGSNDVIQLSFKRIDNGQKCQLKLNEHETLRFKTILCPYH
jgi:hypothetical protein